MSRVTKDFCDLCKAEIEIYRGATITIHEKRVYAMRAFTNDSPTFDLCDDCWTHLSDMVKQMLEQGAPQGGQEGRPTANQK